MQIAKINKIINAGENREQYFENPISDYINLDKQEIRLINGIKKGSYIRHSPDHYGPEDSFGYVLLTGFNCQARCSYCYLQSYFKSPDMVRFSNFDDYLIFIDNFIQKFNKQYPDKTLIFYDGDYKDSLGYYGLAENINNINKFTDLLKPYSNVFLEIRTKNILPDFNLYNDLNITPNLITAITFGPQEMIDRYETGTSSFDLRFKFAQYLTDRSSNLGIRIDPIILDKDDSLDKYLGIINQLKELNSYNRGVGLLRLKQNLYKVFKKKGYSIINNLILQDGFRMYDKTTRNEAYFQIKSSLEGQSLYICMDDQ